MYSIQEVNLFHYIHISFYQHFDKILNHLSRND